MSNTQNDIKRICDSVRDLLLEKNRKYGDSALEPVRVMSQSTPVEQILVRIDDKLSRISRGTGLVGDDEDVITDLIGYFVLLRIALERQSQNAVVDSADAYDKLMSAYDNCHYDDEKLLLNEHACGWDPSVGPTC